ncbi:YbgA family protein [Desmospora profundinema]|uniref:Uncharacterized protein YbbK (DUF523 family)/uncharacterized protein YbgA (DUF1722 family) n=1 Tax=Desmospora profundinema TaxID=1571184 RepID=A0ABU1IPU7_9BACL|nr:DUF523 and DUF1722 domain-containing protein [Desmospora profundinema]MDR6226149.1 uncharacterized protein YbbK (DUF523 family)/uncharacterized protein YbgA (DUF1722 family) [Desmospora profundinema]
MEWQPDQSPIRIGISSCLLGERVRYNGAHKRDRFIVDSLGSHVEWVPVCPEVELGMGVPREPIRLEADPDRPSHPRLMGIQSRQDWTDDMAALAERRAKVWEREPLSGYIWKKGSPSCGMDRIPIHGTGKGGDEKQGRGLFASALMERFPLLPVVDEEKLKDPDMLSRFIGAVAARHRWLRLLASNPGPPDLLAFHRRHEMALSAHSPDALPRLDRLASGVDALTWEECLTRYETGLMEAMWTPATPDKHAKVMQAMVERLEATLDPADREELRACVEAYHRGWLPLAVPLTLLRHHVRRNPDGWAEKQTYLSPLAIEWKWK